MKKEHLLIVILCLALLLPCLAACTDKGGTTVPTGTDAPETDQPTGSESGSETDEPLDPSMRYDVPPELRFPDRADGRPNTVHILQRAAQVGVTDELHAEESGKSNVEQKIYARQALISERLNVTFDYQYEPGAATTAQQNAFQARMRNINSSGVTDPWLVSGMIYSMPALAGGTEGILYDLYAMQEGKTNYFGGAEKIWWNRSVTEQAELNGKLYFAVSEANISVYNRMTVMLVNLPLAAELCQDADGNAYDFRQMVYDQEWTLDTFLSMLTQIGDGDAENPATSTWGVTVRNDATTIDGVLLASGIRITQRDDNGVPTADGVFNTEWNKNRVQKIQDLYNKNLSLYKSNSAADVENPFVNGKAVFHINLMLAVAQENIRGMSQEFALLPLPKFDDTQKDYQVASHNEFNAMCVLTCTTDTDIASAVLEMLAYESYQNIRPALFEDTYALRSLQTPANREMFYYILDRSYVDFAQVYGQIFGLPIDYMREAVRYNRGVTDTFDSRESKTVTRLQDYVKKVWGLADEA